MFFSHALIHWSAAWIAERFPCWGPCWLAGVFGPGIWLAGGTTTSRSEVLLRNPGWLAWILIGGFLVIWDPFHWRFFFLPAVRVRWKLRLAVIPLLALRSQQVFAHTTTAQLSCHVQNFVAITVFYRDESEARFPSDLSCDGGTVSETGPWAPGVISGISWNIFAMFTNYNYCLYVIICFLWLHGLVRGEMWSQYIDIEISSLLLWPIDLLLSDMLCCTFMTINVFWFWFWFYIGLSVTSW